MKHKHNKKRNTAFLFESLIKEMTKNILDGNTLKVSVIKSILKETFAPNKSLTKELDCYRALLDTDGLDQYTAEKMIFHAKKKYEKLDQKQIFKEQSHLIKKINSELSSQLYKNFVPNYRSYATISQIFNPRTPIKRKILMEKQLVAGLVQNEKTPQPYMETVNALVVKKYAERFNEQYSHLLSEQKELLSKFILAVGENRADFVVYLTEELSRIRTAVAQSLSLEEVCADSEMTNNTKKLLEQIDTIKIPQVGEKTLLKLLKLQNLVAEYHANDN
jgi:hypothetical protein